MVELKHGDRVELIDAQLGELSPDPLVRAAGVLFLVLVVVDYAVLLALGDHLHNARQTSRVPLNLSLAPHLDSWPLAQQRANAIGKRTDKASRSLSRDVPIFHTFLYGDRATGVLFLVLIVVDYVDINRSDLLEDSEIAPWKSKPFPSATNRTGAGVTER